jgi:hypothetical protein
MGIFSLLGRVPLLAWVALAVGLWGGIGRMQLAAERAAHAGLRAEVAEAKAAAAAEVARLQAADQQRAAAAAATLEDVRDAIRTRLRAPQPRAAAALAAPVPCPTGPDAPPLALGDLVVPAGALDRVRAAAGAVAAPAAPADSGRPGQALRPGPRAP